MDGVLNLLKPPGMTSHDVVAFVRRTLGVKKAGHAGTLDPGAAGVLPVCVGRATRISEYLLGSDKAYRAVAVLGLATDTQDAAGRVLSEGDASGVTREALEAALARFRGTIRQAPPMVSAVKHRGERLYRLARRGETVERPARPVTVFSLELAVWRPGRRAVAVLDITCSKGTYVRTLCHDLGQALGCGAYLYFLVRLRHGPFALEGSVTLEEMAEAVRGGALGAILLPMSRALEALPQVAVSAEEARRLAHGVAPFPRPAGRISADSLAGPLAGRLVRVHGPLGELLAVARLYPEPRAPGQVAFKLEKVLIEP